jgi:hypothetical protein
MPPITKTSEWQFVDAAIGSIFDATGKKIDFPCVRRKGANGSYEYRELTQEELRQFESETAW